MGISPIVNLVPLDLTRPIETDIGLPPMERIENSSRTGDETYSPSEERSADESDQEQEEPPSEEDPEFEAHKSQNDEKTDISFFA
jgi:hypothetical protein